MTGQCSCVQGVSGRDCSQCQARQVLVQGGICKTCDHACVAPLLDEMDEIAQFYSNANVSDIDPAPMLRLTRYQKQAAELETRVQRTKEVKARVEASSGGLSAIRPHAELTMLEVKKYEKAATGQDQKAKDQLNDVKSLDHEAERLHNEIRGILI